jgi:D-arabinose 1-dehydrogenase-like Zn-dependent alcohol dehydrogenase
LPKGLKLQSQKIINYGEALVTVEEDTPKPQGAEVLMKVAYCGVCHTDVHIQDGYFTLSGEKQISTSSRRSLPFTPGHEIFGEVVALGPEAHNIKIGDCRAVYPWIGCGGCSTCRQGFENLCDKGSNSIGTSADGGYSDHLIVPHSKYLVNTDGIEDALAATYMCSGVTAYSAINKIGRLLADEKVLILGLGGVGMSGLQIGKAILRNDILAADIDDLKLKYATDVGAEKVYNASDDNSIKKLMQDTDGGVSAVVDFVGSEDSSKYGLSCIRRGGKYVVVGLYGGALSIPLATIPLRAISIIGTLTGSLDETKAVVSLARAGKIKPIPIEKRAIGKASESLNDLRNGNTIGRVVLVP